MYSNNTTFSVPTAPNLCTPNSTVEDAAKSKLRSAALPYTVGVSIPATKANSKVTGESIPFTGAKAVEVNVASIEPDQTPDTCV